MTNAKHNHLKNRILQASLGPEAKSVYAETGKTPRELADDLAVLETDSTQEICELKYFAKALKAQNKELLEALENIIKANPVFRSKPVGAPNSQARDEQNWQIECEEEIGRAHV